MPWEKGKSGNPGGRPKEDAEVKKLARGYGKKAIEKLAALLDSEDPRIQVSAAQAILDRGFGKPAQSMTVSGDEDNPLVIAGGIKLVRPESSD